MEKVLVTGGAGFIGTNFVRHLLRSRSDAVVVNVDALTYAGTRENLRDLPDERRHIFVHGDICDSALVEDVLRRHAIDTIVHFAAESHVDRSIVRPGQFVQTNVVGTFNLIEQAKRYWLGKAGPMPAHVRFHHVSTDEVYGTLSADDPAFTERTPYDPSSPYSASKASSDHMVRAYGRTYGLPITITNCSNNYGPFQFPEKLIPLIIMNALTGQPLPIYGDGQQVRDWLYVADHCEAILTVLAKGRVGETYNVGGNNQPANIEIVRKICAVLDEQISDSPFAPHASLIRFVADRPGHDRRYAIDQSKLNGELGWFPSESLDSGILKTVAWYRANAKWLATITDNQAYHAWIERNYDNRIV